MTSLPTPALFRSAGFAELRDFVTNTTLDRVDFPITGFPGSPWVPFNFTLMPSRGTTCSPIAAGSDPTIDCGAAGAGAAHACVRCSGELIVGLASTGNTFLGRTTLEPGPWGLLRGRDGALLPVLASGADALARMGVSVLRSGGAASRSLHWKVIIIAAVGGGSDVTVSVSRPVLLHLNASRQPAQARLSSQRSTPSHTRRIGAAPPPTGRPKASSSAPPCLMDGVRIARLQLHLSRASHTMRVAAYHCNSAGATSTFAPHPVVLAVAGPFELVDMAAALDIEPILGLSAAQTASDWADLVEYCWGGPGTTWGAVRVADGHPLPLNVTAFELGGDGEYNAGFVAQVAAMEARAAAVGAPPLRYLVRTRL